MLILTRGARAFIIVVGTQLYEHAASFIAYLQWAQIIIIVA